MASHSSVVENSEHDLTLHFSPSGKQTLFGTYNLKVEHCELAKSSQ